MTTWPSSFFDLDKSLLLEGGIQLRFEFLQEIYFPLEFQKQLAEWNQFFFRKFLRIDIPTNPDFSIIPDFPKMVGEEGKFDMEQLMEFSKSKRNLLETMNMIMEEDNKNHKEKPLTYEILKKVEQLHLYRRGFVAHEKPVVIQSSLSHLPEEPITPALAESLRGEIDPKLYRRGLTVIRKIRTELVGTCVIHEKQNGKTFFVHDIDFLRRPNSFFIVMNSKIEKRNKTFLQVSEEPPPKYIQPLFIPLSDPSQTYRLLFARKGITITHEFLEKFFDPPDVKLYLERPEPLGNLSHRRNFMLIPEYYAILPKMSLEAGLFGNVIFGWYYDVLFENNIHSLEQEVGYKFHSRKLLKEVFIHPSSLSHSHNNKLDFLGHLVSSLAVKLRDLLMNPNASSHQLTNLKYGHMHKMVSIVTNKVNLLDFTIRHSTFQFLSLHERFYVFRLLGAIFTDGGWDCFLDYFFLVVMKEEIPKKETLLNLVKFSSMPYGNPLLSEDSALKQLSYAEDKLNFKFQDKKSLVLLAISDIFYQSHQSFTRDIKEEMNNWTKNITMQTYTQKIFPEFSMKIKTGKILADTFEAVLGALFIVEGYYRAKEFVTKFLDVEKKDLE